MRNTALRSQECWDKYQAHTPLDHCFLCKPEEHLKIIREYNHWFICENQYPYDQIATVHHMLVPRAHVQFEEKLEREVHHELFKIFWQLDSKSEYDAIMRNFVKAQSHTAHLHYHLLTYIRA